MGTMFSSDLLKMMQALGIKEGDFKESFIHASGPGGQNVNKVATCVVLFHPASGVRVRVQEERTQERNRVRARWLLCEKILTQRNLAKKQVVAAREKIRRQKRRRSLSGKERVLEKKHRHSQQKALRRNVDWRKPDVW